MFLCGLKIVLFLFYFLALLSPVLNILSDTASESLISFIYIRYMRCECIVNGAIFCGAL